MASAGTFPVRILAQVAGNEPQELAVYHVPMPKQLAPQVNIQMSAPDKAFVDEATQSLSKFGDAMQRAYR